jgi:uncharacterized protein YjiS (DUF1127 family)
MEGISNTYGRRMQHPANYVLIGALIGLVAAGWRALSARLAAFAAARRRAQTRRELHGLSDRYLKDIGLDRNEIDGLFR